MIQSPQIFVGVQRNRSSCATVVIVEITLGGPFSDDLVCGICGTAQLTEEGHALHKLTHISEFLPSRGESGLLWSTAAGATEETFPRKGNTEAR